MDKSTEGVNNQLGGSKKIKFVSNIHAELSVQGVGPRSHGVRRLPGDHCKSVP